MKRLLLAAMGMAALVGTAEARDTYVRGYVRSDGTYVAPHYRSAPDGNPYNNYSTQGNYNPYTGQPGTVNPYSNPYSSGGILPRPTPNNRRSGYGF